MNQKRPNQRPKKLDLQGARGAVFAIAISSTIGFWAIFSRVDGAQTSSEEVQEPISHELPAAQEQESMVFALPPIPTLIPTLDASILSPSAAPNGIPEPSMISASIPTPQIITLPKTDKSSKSNKAPRKQKGGGGGKTTSTRSS
jgi:hypothetical protein